MRAIAHGAKRNNVSVPEDEVRSMIIKIFTATSKIISVESNPEIEVGT
jgi:hypothetical protein